MCTLLRELANSSIVGAVAWREKQVGSGKKIIVNFKGLRYKNELFLITRMLVEFSLKRFGVDELSINLRWFAILSLNPSNGKYLGLIIDDWLLHPMVSIIIIWYEIEDFGCLGCFIFIFFFFFFCVLLSKLASWWSDYSPKKDRGEANVYTFTTPTL